MQDADAFGAVEEGQPKVDAAILVVGGYRERPLELERPSGHGGVDVQGGQLGRDRRERRQDLLLVVGEEDGCVRDPHRLDSARTRGARSSGTRRTLARKRREISSLIPDARPRVPSLTGDAVGVASAAVTS